MALNLDAIGTVTEPQVRRWTSTDALLYAVGVGAGYPDPTSDLTVTTENSAGVVQQVLPTFCTLLGATGALRGVGSFNPAMLVHAEQHVELHAPLPPEGAAVVVGRLDDILDKRSGALVVSSADAHDEASGAPLFTARSAVFIRGEGGFAPNAPASPPVTGPPERTPDHVVTLTTLPNQALVYRLSGDRNPLHSDPAFAARAGFDRPILHGLCTYGMACRALLRALADDDPSRMRAMSGRFTSPVFPGEDLTTEVWREPQDDGVVRAWFRTTSSGGAVVLDRGTCAVAPATG
jgi:acyl dehydratase